MNDPNPPPPGHGTRDQTPEDVARPAPRPRFAAGDPVPNREMWHLERKLGEGGFGEVWLARHEWKDERVAVKFCTHAAARHQLVTHEKKVIARVMRHATDHPHVVPLLDCNLSGDTPWLIYQYVPGGTLAAQVPGWAELPLARRLARTVRIVHALAAALARFHRLDPPLVHRDLKPHNVLMDGRVPRLTDFGLGSVAPRPADGTGGTDSYSAASVTLPSALRAMGTKGYAPEEQMLGSPPDPRDDVYALGVMAYRLARADLRAFPGADAADELRAMRVPSALIGLIVRSVAMNPDRRPRDAGEWQDELFPLLPRPADPPADAAPAPAEADRRGGLAAQMADWLREHRSRAARADAGRGPAAPDPIGTLPDDAASREALERAAAQGNAVAQAHLAEWCEHGTGGPRDLPRALELYRQAATQGNEKARSALRRFGAAE